MVLNPYYKLTENIVFYRKKHYIKRVKCYFSQ